MRLPDVRSRVVQCDALCAAGLLLALLGAWAGLWRPARALAAQEQSVALGVAQAEQDLQRMRRNLRTLRSDVERLRAALNTQIRRAPVLADLNDLLDRVVRHARQAGLDVRSVIPAAPVRQNGYATYDVQLEAAGRCAQFIALLDALARHEPYHSVEEFRIVSDPKRPLDGVCLVSLRLRLYLLLPDDPSEESAS